MKQLTEEQIKNFSNFSESKVNYVTKHNIIPEWVILNLISQYQKLSEDFIREYEDYLDFDIISSEQKLSEDFIREYEDYLDLHLVSITQKLSESFIKEFAERVNWSSISIYQKLSENFIREFVDRVDWNSISKYQKLSEDFIKEFSDRVNLEHISFYQDISDEFREKFNLKRPENNWRFISREDKLQKIKESKKYEIQDDEFVIAYKGIRSDGYSNFNFQYHYEVGGIYECHADWNIKEKNSFGLSAWTLKGSREYCKQRIIKVKIHIDDIAALVYQLNKIRCQKFEVVEIVEEN